MQGSLTAWLRAHLLEPLEPRLRPLAVAAACAAMAALFRHHALAASRLVDGVRWYWLDDDQMISMRYARNLAEGHGLVWNPGEYVEGYTNLLWTLLMALVHGLGAPDASASLYVQLLGFALSCLMVLQAARLLGLLAPRRRWTVPLGLLLIVSCEDIVFWAVNGYETTLLSVLQLTFLVELVRRRGRSWLGYLALALIPLTRADALHLFVANAVLTAWFTRCDRAVLWRLGLCLTPTLAHFAFRLIYYGDLLPNTYYLKVVGLPNKYARGYEYSRRFAHRYGVPAGLAIATATIMLGRDPRALLLLVSVGATAAYSVLVGGDNFPGLRFFAHVLPVVMVFAALGAAVVVKHWLGRAAWVGALLATSLPITYPWRVLARPAGNGDPYQQLHVAAALRKNARPDSTVAVMAAGIVPYFMRLRAMDVLGKSDPYIAHLPYHPGSQMAHGKFAPDYTLGQNPDLVVSYRAHRVVRQAPRLLPATNPGADYVLSFVASDPFRRRYLPFPIEGQPFARFSQVYTHRDSPEAARRRQWKPVAIRP